MLLSGMASQLSRPIVTNKFADKAKQINQAILAVKKEVYDKGRSAN